MPTDLQLRKFDDQEMGPIRNKQLWRQPWLADEEPSGPQSIMDTSQSLIQVVRRHIDQATVEQEEDIERNLDHKVTDVGSMQRHSMRKATACFREHLGVQIKARDVEMMGQML
jgi:hypothetical protein